MNVISERLRRRIQRDFPDAGSAAEVCRLVAEAVDSERIQAAIVFVARGDLEGVRHSVELAGLDWRDVLVNGGLAEVAWAARLETELGPR